ncbi:MAG TPA: hypothetical protein VK459_22145 [Polyangiaceae bacterium]|nr:hypothetical protein [Polyangiaceae bacterium]
MSALHQIATYSRELLRTFGVSPMGRIMDELSARGFALDHMAALEPFGREGRWHTMDYADRVASLTVWELDPAMEPGLRRNLPNAARKITDAYAEIRQTDGTFDLIVVDAPTMPHGDFCEHFDFVPLVFRVARDPFVLIVNVVTRPNKKITQMIPGFFGEHHLAARRSFYECRDPEHLDVDELAKAYRRCVEAQGWELEWWFMRGRDRVCDYFVMKLRRGVRDDLAAPSLPAKHAAGLA